MSPPVSEEAWHGRPGGGQAGGTAAVSERVSQTSRPLLPARLLPELIAPAVDPPGSLTSACAVLMLA